MKVNNKEENHERYFDVAAHDYSEKYDFHVYRPASLDNPKNNAVMFMNAANVHRTQQLIRAHQCIIFYPDGVELPDAVMENNLVIPCADPRVEYCRFFRENNITYYPPQETMKLQNGAFVSEQAVIGHDVTIMPMAYIGGEVVIGDHVYIGCGVKIVGSVQIGDHVVIRENSVIGADGLSTDRDENGRALTMPQFGGVVIEDDVQIGALTVIARGAIDNTVIHQGSKIDNCTFISHNVQVGEDTFIVGETILFGGSSTGKGVFISGNSTVRNKVRIGDHAFVGMGCIVTKNVVPGSTVMGNPAREKK